jgi:hypothetical protein
MKLSSLFSITENAPETPQEHELLTALVKAVKEVEGDITYDFSDGTMDSASGNFMGSSSTLMDKFGKCFADPDEIANAAENEKLVLFVAAYDGMYEEAFIVPTNNEVFIKRSSEQGSFTVKFRGKSYSLQKEELEKLLVEFYDKEILKYQHIGKQKQRRWDDDLDYEDISRSTYNRLKARWADSWDDRELDEDDYEFNEETFYGALVYKNYHHR